MLEESLKFFMKYEEEDQDLHDIISDSELSNMQKNFYVQAKYHTGTSAPSTFVSTFHNSRKDGGLLRKMSNSNNLLINLEPGTGKK